MIKICFLLLLASVHFACARAERQSEPELGDASVGAAEQPVPAPANGFPTLSEKDLKRLDERFPKQMRDVLEKAQRIQVYETVLCTPGKGEMLTPKEKGRFQGCKVLRQADVTDPEKRKQLVEEIILAIGSHHSGNACFDPRHGIRAEHERKRVELLICFECENFRGASSVGSFGGGFSPDAGGLFERILGARTSDYDQ